MSGPCLAVWSPEDWAGAVADLPAGGPLPCRTVLVPRPAVAHALRRALAESGRVAALAGTRFLTLDAAAASVLERAGVAFAGGEEALRPLRLLALFREGLELEYFAADLLGTRPGWDAAFAATIADMEAAGLRPETVAAAAEPRLRDAARVWRRLDEAAGSSWTRARILAEAGARLGERPGLWPHPGPVLAVVTGHERPVEASLVRATPGLTLGLLGGRPLRERHLERVARLHGVEAGRALLGPAPRGQATERDLLVSYLFEAPRVLAAAERPRSAGPDGSVRLEEHAGVEAEVEATADWVAEQVAAGTALEDIAVLVPALDPLASLVAGRLGCLPWPEGALPVHVAGGLPLTGTAAGARALAVVRALRAHLEGDALAGVLPALRAAGEEGRHLTHGEAMELVWSLGTAGGNPAHPAGALEWAERLEAREPQLEAQLAEARAASDDPERSGLARTARGIERLLASLRASRPAVAALVDVARLVVGGAPLDRLWPALRDFLGAWLLQPGDGQRVQDRLDERLASLAGRDEADGVTGGPGQALGGDDALGVVEQAIASTRVEAGAPGDPAVHVGTVASAVGLRFAAVRVIGLAEGHLPPPLHEDPVLPDRQRETLGMPTADDRALAALHALDVAVRAAGRTVALSAPRLDLDRSQREPSAVLLEAAAALGRPDAVTGARGPVVPDKLALARDAFAPARAEATQSRRRVPLGEAAWQDGVAHGALGLPPHWRDAAALDLARVVGQADDGRLGDRAADLLVPGLGADWPVSPTALENLLRCPYQFLQARLLGLDEPPDAPLLREIQQPAYGSLVHGVLAAFFAAHGPRFCKAEGKAEDWLRLAAAIADARFEAFLEQYPLIGDRVRALQRDRLQQDVRDLLRAEWELGARRFVASERPFGTPVPLRLTLGRRTLFLRGTMDRVDSDGRRTLVRDFKTGRVRARAGRDAEPDHVADLQIAVYGLAAERLAGEWRSPAAVGVAYVGRHGQTREFAEDFAGTLAPAARHWLGVAAELLAGRAFPRTSRASDCEYCAFRPVCGDDVHERAARVLREAGGALAELLALKGGEAEEEDE